MVAGKINLWETELLIVVCAVCFGLKPLGFAFAATFFVFGSRFITLTGFLLRNGYSPYRVRAAFATIMSAIYHTNGCDKEVDCEYVDEPVFHYCKITDKKVK